MHWWVAILSTLLVVQGAGLIVLLVWVYRIMQGVDCLVVYLHDTEQQMDENPALLHTPDELPLSKHLHDVIAQSVVEDADVGRFGGREAWTPPPEEPAP